MRGTFVAVTLIIVVVVALALGMLATASAEEPAPPLGNPVFCSVVVPDGVDIVRVVYHVPSGRCWLAAGGGLVEADSAVCVSAFPE